MHWWSGKPLGAWAAEGVEASMGPSDGQVFDNFAAEYLGGLKLQVQQDEG